MPALDPNSALFVAGRYALEPGGGGVQRCTREYIAVAEAAGYTLHFAPYDVDRRPLTRVQRKLLPRPYRNLVAPQVVADIAHNARRLRVAWVFFKTEAAQIAPALGNLRAEGIRFALLSHGVDSSDFLHTARVTQKLDEGHRASAGDALWLGRQLFEELEQHRHFAAIFCLSETDRHIEQWLGGRSVHVMPRIIDSRPLDWRPVPGRLGSVGTLVHAPNAEGLTRLCRALGQAQRHVRLRLIGRPERLGHEFAREFPMVDYLGALSDREFEEEARTWCAFVNPIFCYPRGCSTKLAVPLGWHLPVASTRAGARGYVWDESLVPVVETAAELAALALRLSDVEEAAKMRPAIARLVANGPRLADLAAQMRAVLNGRVMEAPS